MPDPNLLILFLSGFTET
ncbi:hypothetical protein PDE_09093 [Penicillium oxalicum 114-2]|uniref:Uncharacterized protein n=1 Tax=Penicillium oxalicum (strain 114-2 / CGMCC 5302) TaxID=933388 RepID=S7ZZ73_PENO1|nr:hypothetical protein PDE_09093 [Penicillium oxalicum 114-2]